MISALLNKAQESKIQMNLSIFFQKTSHKRNWFGQAHKCNENMNIILCHILTDGIPVHAIKRSNNTQLFMDNDQSKRMLEIRKCLTVGTAGCKRKASDKAA
jgi:hypothetical protein